MKGHTREKCYKLIGYPVDFKYKMKGGIHAAHNVFVEDYKRQGPGGGTHTTKESQHNSSDASKSFFFTHDQYTQIMKLLNKEKIGESLANMAGTLNAFLVETCRKEWIINTGATNHMISDANLLLNKIKLNKAEAKKVHLPNGGVTYVTHIGSCELSNGDIVDNVLCFPDFKNNLLSVSKLTKELKCMIAFYHDFCIFQDLCI